MRTRTAWLSAVAPWALLASSVVAQPPSPGARQGGPSPARLQIDRDLEFGRAGGRALKLDLYRREPAADPSPIVVWIHGGAGEFGKDPSPAAALVTDGFAVASIEYRTIGEAAFPAPLHDCKAAVRWLRAHAAQYNLDAAHIGVWGYELGGYLASLLGTTGDVEALEGDGNDLDQSSRVQAVAAFAARVGPAATDETAGQQAASPATYASGDDPPFLVVHGTADGRSPARQSEEFVAALKLAGVDASLDLQLGVGGDLDSLLSLPMLDEVASFFAELKGERPPAGLSSFLPSPSDAWLDPVAVNLGGTLYRTYPTPTRGPGTSASYRIYLPPGYETDTTRRFPVIYFTHGMRVDSKRPLNAGYVARIDRAIRSGVMPPTIVVVIQGLNRGWWVDSKDGKHPMESVIIKDLIPHIEATYRTIASREGRAIEGHSMGGYGALRLGFKYPDLFVAVTANSPALINVESFSAGNDLEMFRETFGGDRAYYEASAPWSLAEKNAAAVRTQRIRIICGEEDRLVARARWMDGVLSGLGIPHEFIGVPGAPHNHDQLLAFEAFDAFAFYGEVFRGLNGYSR